MPKKTKLKNSNKRDMINGPIWNKLPRFALPVAATAILEQLFNCLLYTSPKKSKIEFDN